MFRPSSLALIALAPVVVACGPLAQRGADTVHNPAPVYSPAPTPTEMVVEEPDPAPEVEAASVEAAPVESVDAGAEDDGEPTITYHLRRGETLTHFARWAELPVETLAEGSEVDLFEPLAVGTLIRVPAGPDRRAQIEMRRDAHHERRVEGYLASRGGSLTTTFHVVRSGESAWSIARENGGLPVWLVEAFNPSLDLEALLPGQAVMLPVTADMIDVEDAVAEGPTLDEALDEAIDALER